MWKDEDELAAEFITGEPVLASISKRELISLTEIELNSSLSHWDSQVSDYLLWLGLLLLSRVILAPPTIFY